MASRDKEIRLALLGAAGVTVLFVGHDALRAMLDSTGGFIAFVIMAMTWVLECVFLGVTIGLERGWMHKETEGKIAVSTPVRIERVQPEPKPSGPRSSGRAGGCLCPEVWVVEPYGGMTKKLRCKVTPTAHV